MLDQNSFSNTWLNATHQFSSNKPNTVGECKLSTPTNNIIQTLAIVLHITHILTFPKSLHVSHDILSYSERSFRRDVKVMKNDNQYTHPTKKNKEKRLSFPYPKNNVIWPNRQVEPAKISFFQIFWWKRRGLSVFHNIGQAGKQYAYTERLTKNRTWEVTFWIKNGNRIVPLEIPKY